MKPDIKEENASVKISTCGKCSGVVRIAMAHMMNAKSKKEFAKEAMDYNLSISEKPFLQYKKDDQPRWCKC